MQTERKCRCEHEIVESDNLPAFNTERYPEITVTVLDAAREHTCTKCGEVLHVSIVDEPGLEVAIAAARISHPQRLHATEIVFIRKLMGLKAVELAHNFGVSAETVSRWEKGKMPMSPSNEKLFRIMSGLNLSSLDPTNTMSFDLNEVVKLKLHGDLERKKLHFRFRRVIVKQDRIVKEAYDPFPSEQAA